MTGTPGFDIILPATLQAPPTVPLSGPPSPPRILQGPLGTPSALFPFVSPRTPVVTWTTGGLGLSGIAFLFLSCFSSLKHILTCKDK